MRVRAFPAAPRDYQTSVIPNAADREGQRYGIEENFVRAGMEGRAYESVSTRRTLLDWLVIFAATAIFAVLAAMAKFPHIAISVTWAAALTVAMLALLATCGIVLWRTTQFR